MSIVVVYGGVDCGAKMGIRPALSTTSIKNKKMVLATAKKRKFNMVVIKDKVLIKKIRKLEIPEAWQDRGKNGVIMVPFAAGEKLIKLFRLCKEEDKLNESKLTLKAFKVAKKKVAAKSGDAPVKKTSKKKKKSKK